MAEYALGLYEKSMPETLSFSEKLEALSSAGFDYLELSIDETDAKLERLDWSLAEIGRLRRVQEEAGVYIQSMCLSGHRKYPLGHPSGEVRARGLAIMRKAVRLAKLLGIRIIQLAGYDVYYEPSDEGTRNFFRDNIRVAAAMAAEEGVLLGFETMETPFMDTLRKALYWVETVQSPYLKIYPDIGNMTNAAVLYQHSVSGDLQRGAGNIIAMHLKETKPGVYREVPYGEGHVDFRQAVEQAFSLGVRMFVAEFWHKGEEHWREILRENNRFLRSFLNPCASC
ncbi:MAG: L-ribulose-5-phosphate 3-epimerase [Spirochaetaceae bacterium]|nr:L-ribulose-5-phosphate 3-epimerase [Spirochaetaceae bacterium]